MIIHGVVMTNLSLVKGHNFNLPITLEDEQKKGDLSCLIFGGVGDLTQQVRLKYQVCWTHPTPPNEEFDPDNLHFLQWKRIFQSQGRSLIGGSSYKCTKKTYVNVYAS